MRVRTKDGSVADDPGSRRHLGWLLDPPVLVALPVVISAVSWLIPWYGSPARAFTARSPLTARAVLVLVSWHAVLVGAAWLGARTSSAMHRPANRRDPTFERHFYRMLSTIAIGGVVATFVLISRVIDIGAALEGQQANELRNAIPYSAGIATMRYATAPAGGIALSRIVLERRVDVARRRQPRRARRSNPRGRTSSPDHGWHDRIDDCADNPQGEHAAVQVDHRRHPRGLPRDDPLQLPA